MKILKIYDVPPQLLKVKGKLYENTRARIALRDGEIEYFELTTGVLQNDTLAPYLFTIVLGRVLHQRYNERRLEQGF